MGYTKSVSGWSHLCFNKYLYLCKLTNIQNAYTKTIMVPISGWQDYGFLLLLFDYVFKVLKYSTFNSCSSGRPSCENPHNFSAPQVSAWSPATSHPPSLFPNISWEFPWSPGRPTRCWPAPHRPMSLALAQSQDQRKGRVTQPSVVQ